MTAQRRQDRQPGLGGPLAEAAQARVEALETNPWVPGVSDETLDDVETDAVDDFGPARGIFWWGLGGLLVWGLIVLLF